MNSSESVAARCKSKLTDAPSSKKAKMEKDARNTQDKYAYLKLPQDPRPDVYTQKPPQPKEKKPGQLTPEQLDHFFDKGFVLVKDYFDKTLLDKAREAIKEQVDDLANLLYNTGKIKNKHEDKGLFQRLTYLNKEYPGAAVVLHKLGTLPNEFCDIWSWDNLLNAVEQIVGPDIAGHPVWNLRTKTPRNEQVTVPWHQDNAYLEPCGLNAMQLTAWIPLLDTNKNNGCMVIASGGHRKGITATHTCCAGGTWYVDLAEKEMVNTLGIDMEKDLVLCEVPYGGVLFLNNAVPHKSMENHSDQIRWSLDLRWQRPDLPNGFYGLRKNVLLRSSKDPNLKVDWSDVYQEQTFKWAKAQLKGDDDKLNPVICGPWMHRWELVHLNKHTEPLTDDLLNCKWHIDKA